MRTLEERLKFDSGLPVGRSLVCFKLKGRERKALVGISPRGVVRCLTEPNAGDMYSTWWRVKGDKSIADGAVIVWGARDPEMRRMFDAAPVATLTLERAE